MDGRSQQQSRPLVSSSPQTQSLRLRPKVQNGSRGRMSRDVQDNLSGFYDFLGGFLASAVVELFENWCTVSDCRKGGRYCGLFGSHCSDVFALFPTFPAKKRPQYRPPFLAAVGKMHNVRNWQLVIYSHQLTV